jgi:hypothetical protein
MSHTPVQKVDTKETKRYKKTDINLAVENHVQLNADWA